MLDLHPTQDASHQSPGLWHFELGILINLHLPLASWVGGRSKVLLSNLHWDFCPLKKKHFNLAQSYEHLPGFDRKYMIYPCRATVRTNARRQLAPRASLALREFWTGWFLGSKFYLVSKSTIQAVCKDPKVISFCYEFIDIYCNPYIMASTTQMQMAA